MKKSIQIIGEEKEVDFKNYIQLAYHDYNRGGPYVHLYIDEALAGKIKVWLDSELNNRPYICINYEIIYLGMLKEYTAQDVLKLPKNYGKRDLSNIEETQITTKKA